MAPNSRPGEEQVAQWKAQHGEDAVYELGRDDGEFVVYCKKPGRQQLARFAQLSIKDPAKALEMLIDECSLWPEKAVIRAACDREPGLIFGLGNQLTAIAGLGEGFFNRRL